MKTAELDSLEVTIYRGKDDKLVVEISGPGDEHDQCDNGAPDIRVWMNEALIYASGTVGDDLSTPAERMSPKRTK